MREIYVGLLNAYTTDQLPPPDYVALGHIHKTMRVGGHEHVRYCGSLIPLAAVELKHPKDVLLVEFDAGVLKSVQPLPVPMFHTIKQVHRAVGALKQQLTYAAQLTHLACGSCPPPVIIWALKRGSNEHMAVKIKETEDHASYEPRFDFQESPTSNEDQAATIKELLVELNRQRADQSIADYNLKSLGTTLRFVSSISGIEIPRRIDQEYPLTWIKTVKLLFTCNQFIDAHLIRIIEPPGPDTPATIDFFTSPATPATEAVKREISRIISMLEKEIEQAEIDAIGEICDPGRLRETFRQDTNEAVDRILLTHIHVDDDLLKQADDYLAKKTRDFLVSISPLEREPRLHVATYIYLKLLDYVHRLHFDLVTQLTIPHDRGVANRTIDFGPICSKLSALHSRTISRDTNFMDIGDVVPFIEDYQADLARLVSRATGFTYNKRDVPMDKPRAIVALRLYLMAASLPSELNSRPIGVVHVAAAFCSVLHQRKMKSRPTRNSRKYGSKTSAPQKLLDQLISRTSEHLPWTVQDIYIQRTRWYVSALLDRKDKVDSHRIAQIAQSELSNAIFMTLSHGQIRAHLSKYREFMTRAARDFVALHNRQATVYQWRHGD